MPFQKGVVTNPNGRIPISEGGSRNKKTSLAYDKYLGIFETNLDRLETEIATLKGKELADVLAKMAPYIFPALQRVATTFNTEDVEEIKEIFVIGGKQLTF